MSDGLPPSGIVADGLMPEPETRFMAGALGAALGGLSVRGLTHPCPSLEGMM